MDEPFDDPFAGLELDEAFVEGATRREESAAERLARMHRAAEGHRQLREEEEAWRARAVRDAKLAAKRQRRQRRGHRLRWAFVIVGLTSAVAWVKLHPDTTATVAAADRVIGGSSRITERPPRSPEEAPSALGTPPAPAGDGTYAFIGTQSGSANPVAYDPCRPLHLVLNDRTAPAGGEDLVRAAVAEVSAATGLRMVIDGPSDEVPSVDRAPYQPDRYPGRWAPVLIAWSDPTESPDVAGDILGFGGSSALPTDDGTVFITGAVVLDGPQIDQLIAEEGAAAGKAVILHELGHVVGLQHVEDEKELMNPETVEGLTDLAIGDRIGLALLGHGACFPDV